MLVADGSNLSLSLGFHTYSFRETGLEEVDQLHLWEWTHSGCWKECSNDKLQHFYMYNINQLLSHDLLYIKLWALTKQMPEMENACRKYQNGQV